MQEILPLEIRLLQESDIPAAMQLKEFAGWNQTEDDWRRLVGLESRGCFAALLNGELVGTTTTTTYDEQLAWIGMVLVRPENRRQGIAMKLMQTALDYLEGKVPTVKLDATADGQRVYQRLGFEVESVIERWSGIASPLLAADSDGIETAADLDIEEQRELLILDQQAFGANRSRLVEMLIENSCIEPVLARKADGRLSGYALARRGSAADYVGPVVSSNVEHVGPLLDVVLSQLAGRPVYVDVNTAFPGGREMLADRKLVKQRDLIRMRYGKRNNRTSSAVFAIAGPEVG
jgi:GNAT superfamily N-acetyltransferase